MVNFFPRTIKNKENERNASARLSECPGLKVCPLKYSLFFQILRPILKIQLIVNPGFFHSNIVERFGIVIGKFHFPNTVQEEQNQNSQNATLDAPAISANSLNNRKFLHLDYTWIMKEFVWQLNFCTFIFVAMQLENQDVFLNSNSVNSPDCVAIFWFIFTFILLIFISCTILSLSCFNCEADVTISLWISVALCLFFLFWIGWFCLCPKTSESYTLPLPSIRVGLYSNYNYVFHFLSRIF